MFLPNANPLLNAVYGIMQHPAMQAMMQPSIGRTVTQVPYVRHGQSWMDYGNSAGAPPLQEIGPAGLPLPAPSSGVGSSPFRNAYDR